jgi:hypothetical protein
VHDAAPVHVRHSLRERERRGDQLIDRQRLRDIDQPRLTGIGHDDRARGARRFEQLDDRSHTAQPFEYRPLMPQPAVGARPEWLLQDDRARA